MAPQTKEPVTSELLFGAVLVLAGAVLLLDKLDLVEFRDLLRLWPVSLIGIGIYQLLEHNQKSGAQ